jgi:outer membrane protein OmpA-like peptidoglycan-associated protein
VFETNSDVIREGEVPKLETAWSEVVHAIDLYGEVIEIQLFVAGYTDTVGDAASNLALSRRRARSIAAWFRSKGFPGAIHYQGFGESVLAVGTPDGTDEARNRRAVYVLAAQVPPVSEELPKQAWTRL